jgi:hypothetical protein
MSPTFNDIGSFKRFTQDQMVDTATGILMRVKQAMLNHRMDFKWVDNQIIRITMKRYIPLWDDPPSSETEWNSLYPGFTVLAEYVVDDAFRITTGFESRHANISHPWTHLGEFLHNRNSRVSLEEREENGLWIMAEPHTETWNLVLDKPAPEEFDHFLNQHLIKIKWEMDLYKKLKPINESHDLAALIDLFAEYGVDHITIFKLKRKFGIPIDPNSITDADMIELI